MIRAGVGFSAGLDGPVAVEQAASAALAGAGGADLAILFATPAFPAGVESLLAAAVDVLGTSVVVGASAHGVFGAGIECENQASVSILALTGIEAEPFLIPDARGDESRIGAEIASRIPGGPRREDLVVILPDPRLDTVALVRGLDSALRPAHVVGAGAADPFSNSPSQWLGGTVEVELNVLDLTPADPRSDLVPIGKNPQGHEEYWRGKDGVMVVRIPAGEFLMGSPEGEGNRNEQPQHRVYVSEFLIDKTEGNNLKYWF